MVENGSVILKLPAQHVKFTLGLSQARRLVPTLFIAGVLIFAAGTVDAQSTSTGSGQAYPT